jgi:hypothetical protein
MDAMTLGVFLVAALVGSYVPSVTGFAMGMIVIAATGIGVLILEVLDARSQRALELLLGPL